MKKACLFTFVFSALSLNLSILEARAGDLFSEITLEGQKGPHLVIKDNINVRAKPLSKGKKLSKLQKRETVTVLGYAKGTKWFAVQKNGNDIGFVYGMGLAPLIDASFDAPLLGRIDMSADQKPICTYKIIFDGRTTEEQIVFVASDYQAHFTCLYNKRSFTFNAIMFMSEIPYPRDNLPVYQITLDLPDMSTGYEEYLSATSFFHKQKGKVLLDGISHKKFTNKDAKKEQPAQNPAEALKAAIALHFSAFNIKAWRTIAGEIPNPSDIEPE